MKLTLDEQIKQYQENIKRYKEVISTLTNEEDIKEVEMLIEVDEEMIEDLKNGKRVINKDSDEDFLPEYRKNGYFNSPEFKVIEEEVEEQLKSLDLKSQKERDIIKQEILKNKYGINWLPFKERFMPGVFVIID